VLSTLLLGEYRLLRTEGRIGGVSFGFIRQPRMIMLFVAYVNTPSLFFEEAIQRPAAYLGCVKRKGFIKHL
jgi:hypothetical protein